MQKLFPSLTLVSPFLLLAACGDVNLGVEKADGSDAAAGTTAAGTGGIMGVGGSGAGSGGLLATGGSREGTGGRTLVTGGISGTGGSEVGIGGISGTGGRGSGTGGISGTGGTGSGAVPGSGGVTSGTCTASACATDAGQSGSDVATSEDSSAGQVCTYNGRTYPESTSWMAPDGCNECSCVGGYAGCTLLPCDAGGHPTYSCEYSGKSYPTGVTFPSTDGCNICECGFFWYRDWLDGLIGPILASCTFRDCSGSPVGDAGPASDGGIDACVYNGKTYPADTYFPSANGCDECHCRTDGQITCTFQHIGCRGDAGIPDRRADVQIAPDAPLDSAVAPGCDVAAARAAMAASGLVVTGSAETHNETLPFPISGPNWGLKSTACQDGGYDITGLAGQTVCLVKQTIVQACAQAPYLAWAVMSAGSVQCLYKTDDTTPGVYAVNGGYVCP